ncbi:hypothetical protein [Burkholderia glumae]
MTDLKIPDSGYVGLAFIGRLKNKQYEALLAAIRAFEPVVYPATALERIVKSATKEDDAVAERIAESVAGMPLIQKRSDLSQADFLRRLEETLSARWKGDSEELSLIPTVLKRVRPILDIGSLSVSSEALKLAVDSPNSFSDASFAVDMRPVFYPDDESVGGVMLVATMRLSYFDGVDAREVCYSFDEVDLDSLFDEIESAKKKIISLKNLIKKSNIQFVPVTQGRRIK